MITKILIAVMVLSGCASIFMGAITGMWHCYMIGVMLFALAYAWYLEERELWQKKNTKN